MSYNYFCIYCGKKINQEGTGGAAQVLYDLSPILLGTDAEFKVSAVTTTTSKLNFRVTEKQLREWVSTANEDHLVHFSPKRVFAILAQEYNYNNRMIADLTYEKIEDEVKKNTLEDGSLKLFSDKSERQQSDEIEKQALSDGIRKYLQTAQAKDNHTISIFLRRIEENSVTTELRLKDSEGHTLPWGDLPRICPSCGKRIFAHAGAYPHHTIGFIATADSGKTSTIIALTDYAKKAIDGSASELGRIWGKARGIALLNETMILEQEKEGMSYDKGTERLKEDLIKFSRGVAPHKTDVQSTIIYNPTFFITDKNLRKSLLTFVDIPGELCPKKGAPDPNNNNKPYPETKIYKSKMREEYPIILSCDAYIVCFDQTFFGDDNYDYDDISIDIQAPVIWANAIQSLRCEVQSPEQPTRFVPIMILLTKCKEIEEGAPKPNDLTIRDPWERAYMFAADYQDMMPSTNPKAEVEIPKRIAKAIRDKFKDHGDLQHTFYAMLRCSPFGFKAPRKDDEEDTDSKANTSQQISKVEESSSAPDQENLQAQTGEKQEAYYWKGDRYPRNVDLLMKWILCVTGCIPTDGRYALNENNRNSAFALGEKYYVGPQYRDDSPKDQNEALARRVLFVNPGALDRAKVEYQPKGYWLDRIIVTVKTKMNRKITNTSDKRL